MTTGVATVKIRIGYGLGVNSLTNDQDRFGHFVDELERLRRYIEGMEDSEGPKA